jgi:uncharacterized cupin superfamily protein
MSSDAKVRTTLRDPMALEPRIGASYPEAFAEICRRREKRALGNAVGLNHFGVNLVHLPPGQATSQRHWHEQEDEFVYVLEGEVVLVTDAGKETLSVGMAAGFPASAANGHCIVNKSAAVAVLLEVGTRTTGETVHYPDIDLHGRGTPGGGFSFTHKDGRPYGD